MPADSGGHTPPAGLSPAGASASSARLPDSSEDAQLFLHCALVQAILVLVLAATACALEAIWRVASAYRMPLHRLAAGHACVCFLLYAWVLGRARGAAPGH